MKAVVIAALMLVPGGKQGPEPVEPPTWERYEFVAYNWDSETGRMQRPLNKPPAQVYWPLSGWTLNWYKKTWAHRDVQRLTVPQYYMTPFVTRDMTE